MCADPPVARDAVARAVAEALREDVGVGDLTAALIPADVTCRARVSAREDCILCGVAWFSEAFRQLDANTAIHWDRCDGDAIQAGTDICRLEGPAPALLTGERTALNFLQTLSATATAARRYVDAVAGLGATILDTRKTLPGLRLAQKYAVRCGGAQNHRLGLDDAILIKENHIAAIGGIRRAVAAARRQAPDKPIEVEVETLDELREALACGVERVLLDNFSPAQMRRAARERDAAAGPRTTLEASGGIDPDGARDAALAGVDCISVGALTKHIRAVDFSMRFE